MKRFITPRSRLVPIVCFLLAASGLATSATGEERRARDLGIPFQGEPGRLNAITDVAGVEVGHATLIRGEGDLVVGEGPVRTGVTAIFPLGREATEGVFAGRFALNGVGEMTGTVFLEEYGELYGPIALTNTLSIGEVHSSIIEWNRRNIQDESALWGRALPVVAETWDGFLNDIYGQHISREDVFRALDAARSGPVAEGNVGAGTGVRSFEFKSGIGTASRRVETGQGAFTVGVLVQSNFGRRDQLTIAGAPVGEELTELMPEQGSGDESAEEGKSIIVIIATDAPLIPLQLERVARRASLALGRMGSISMDGSGDIFLAFSTANRITIWDGETRHLQMITDVDPLFEATVQATEEAIVNALVAAETMKGIDGNTVHAIPHERLRDLLRKYERLEE